MDLLRIALVGGIVSLDTTAAFQIMISQPLVGGLLAGWAVGDPWLGGWVGLLFQGLYLAEIPVGGRLFPESNLGAVQAAALAVALQTQLHVSFGVSLLCGFFWSLFISLLGGQLTVWMRRLHGLYLPWFDQLIAQDRRRALDLLYGGILLENFLFGAVFTVLAFTAGLAFFTLVLAALPDLKFLAGWGFTLQGGLLGVSLAVFYFLFGNHLIGRRWWWVVSAMVLSVGIWLGGF